MPTYAISHGGGPWPWMKDNSRYDYTELEAALRAIPSQLDSAPLAILVVSAHWEADEFTVQSHPQPPMIYDYTGFPSHTYEIEYAAPGAPDVAHAVSELLRTAGIAAREDASRGFDHGVYAPLFPMYPNADVPIFQLSLRRGLDPAEHLTVGRALTPLRDQGVLIVGSGLPSFHNLSEMGPQSAPAAQQFDSWLTTTLVEMTGEERDSQLTAWELAPSARRAHPREEHLLPVMVAVGAADNDAGTVHYHESDAFGFAASSGYRFG